MKIKQISEKDLKTLFQKIQQIGEIEDSRFSELFGEKDFSMCKDLEPLFEALDYLRVVRKYEKLDIESCRREMIILRSLIK